jgi:hypothetical protein
MLEEFDHLVLASCVEPKSESPTTLGGDLVDQRFQGHLCAPRHAYGVALLGETPGHR